MKAYLAGPIFTERDRNFNSYLEQEILKLCPDMELYLAQNNKSINDKSGCANSADIFVGDKKRLQESDLLITIMSGDLPPIGSSYECAYFCGLCEQNPTKRIIALYDDSREGFHTYSDEKRDAMISGIAENQWPYVNLLAVGFVKKFGTICFSSQELIQEVKKQYDLGFDSTVCGIYKITNLKTQQIYIGQSIDVYQRMRNHTHNSANKALIDQEITRWGADYFKFELIEKCDEDALLQREAYWIEYYDSCDNGYNQSYGGERGNKSQIKKCSCYDLDGKLIKTFDSCSEAARYYGIASIGNLTTSIKNSDNRQGRVLCCNMMWRYGEEPYITPYNKPVGNKKEVYQYDLLTRKFIEKYESIKEAKNQLGLTANHIGAVIQGKRRGSGGFLWAREYFDRLPENYYDQKIDISALNEQLTEDCNEEDQVSEALNADTPKKETKETEKENPLEDNFEERNPYMYLPSVCQRCKYRDGHPCTSHPTSAYSYISRCYQCAHYQSFTLGGEGLVAVPTGTITLSSAVMDNDEDADLDAKLYAALREIWED